MRGVGDGGGEGEGFEEGGFCGLDGGEGFFVVGELVD